MGHTMVISLVVLWIAIQSAASNNDFSAFSPKDVIEYHKCVKASMLKCLNGKSFVI